MEIYQHVQIPKNKQHQIGLPKIPKNMQTPNYNLIKNV